VVRLVVKDFGPFGEAEVELKPLTVFIGRNSVGKSMLAYLIWALTLAIPRPTRLEKAIVDAGGNKALEAVIEKAKRGDDFKEELMELMNIAIYVLPKALAPSVEEALKKVFTFDLDELVREGANHATITLKGERTSIETTINGKNVDVSIKGPSIDEFISEIKTSQREVTISYDKSRFTISVPLTRTSRFSIIELLYTFVSVYIMLTLGGPFKHLIPLPLPVGLFPFLELFSALLPDSRAGISRTLLRPYIPIAITYPDKQYVELYYALAEWVAKESIDLAAVKPLLLEMGCSVEPVIEEGVYTIHIKTWSGKRLRLPQAPSGIREVLTVAIALSSRGPPHVVIIEEPEAHLHPRAQGALARLIAKAVNRGKHVVLTTHSDYMLYRLNDLIALSRSPERARALGFAEDEVLRPESVAAYLVKAEGDRAVVEKLDVGPEGFSEDEFASVAVELAEERARILSS